MKKLLLVLLLLSLSFLPAGHAGETALQSAPINPDFLERTIDAPVLLTDEGYPLGYAPAPVDLSHLTGMRLPSIIRVGFPSHYDLRDELRLTAVKDQGAYGTCWAFATYGSLESWILTNEGVYRDFSENNMANLHGYDWGFNEGGNHMIATGYLARWGGPVSEADDPYPAPGGSTGHEPAAKHVQRVVFIPGRGDSLDNDNIKEALLSYGAVYTSMHWDGGFFNPDNDAFYYDGDASSNHAVAIVGWDDDFDKQKFNPAPEGDGAFIVRNSWGDGWGDGGYFYISYYDARVGSSNAVFNDAQPVDNYSYIYQYDMLGFVNSMGYEGLDSAYFSNIFTARESISVEAVGFYNLGVNSLYEIYVFGDVTPGNPVGAVLLSSASGTIPAPGYHTIDLPTAAAVLEGDLFSVVVWIRTPGHAYPVPVEMRLDGYSSAASAAPGRGFVSQDGVSWADIHLGTPNTSICLKAFGNPACEVYIPDAPSGETLCIAGDFYQYDTGGGDCSESHGAFEYRFSWGDGSVSEWGGASRLNSWDGRGGYTVRAQARCEETGIVSEWSPGLDVSVVVCTVSAPDAPTGEISGLRGRSYEYLCGGAVCHNHHDVEYQFHWGIGFPSEWGPDIRENSWDAAGTYNVMVRARCVVNTQDVSSWSLPLPVSVQDVVHPCVVADPDAPSGEVSGLAGTPYEYSAGGSGCSEGHDVEYRFFWGDSYSDWGGATRSKTWAAPGDYEVRARARCAVNTGNQSGWSPATVVSIDPADETPGPVTPPPPPPAPEPVPVPGPAPEPDPEIVSPGPPPAPSGFNAGFNENGEVVLRWASVPDVLRYRLYVGVGVDAGPGEAGLFLADGLSFHLQAELRSNVTEYSLSGLSPGVRYYFLLTSVDRDGRESSVSSDVVWAVPGTRESGRNDPVQWSSGMDSGAVGSDSSCFIATAAYGSYETREVASLRALRDGVLAKNSGGRAFISFYYAFGPRASALVEENRLSGLVLRMHIAPFARVAGWALNLN